MDGDFRKLVLDSIAVTVNNAAGNRPPVAVCQEVTKPVGSNCTADVAALEVGSGSSDPDGDPITLGLEPAGPYPVGVTHVTLIVEDDKGAKDTCTAKVTVYETDPPKITGCPADRDVELGPVMGLTCCHLVPDLRDEVVAEDTCDDDLVITQDPCPYAPRCGEHGDTVAVTMTVEDGSGNKATCTVTLTLKGRSAPKILPCPCDITKCNDAGACSAVVRWKEPKAYDGCELTSFASTHSPGGSFPVGTTTVTYTATDAAGNTATCSYDVTVNDTEDPTITCSADVVVDTDAGACSATGVALGTPSTGDNCGVASIVSNYNGTADASDVYPVGATSVE
jgi:hypothetical protein